MHSSCGADSLLLVACVSSSVKKVDAGISQSKNGGIVVVTVAAAMMVVLR